MHRRASKSLVALRQHLHSLVSAARQLFCSSHCSIVVVPQVLEQDESHTRVCSLLTCPGCGLWIDMLSSTVFTFTLTLRAFSRHFYPKQLTISIHMSEEKYTTLYHCRYSEDVHRTKCQALTIVNPLARLTHPLCPTKLARIRCYPMLSTHFKCKDMQQTISTYVQPTISV